MLKKDRQTECSSEANEQEHGIEMACFRKEWHFVRIIPASQKQENAINRRGKVKVMTHYKSIERTRFVRIDLMEERIKVLL